MPPSREVEPRPLVARIRFCAIYSVAALVALLVGEARGVTHPMWITTTVLGGQLADLCGLLAHDVLSVVELGIDDFAVLDVDEWDEVGEGGEEEC